MTEPGASPLASLDDKKTAIRRASKFWHLGTGTLEDARRFKEALQFDEADDLPAGPEPENADLAPENADVVMTIPLRAWCPSRLPAKA